MLHFYFLSVFLTEVNQLCVERPVRRIYKCQDAVEKIKNEIPNARYGGTVNSFWQPIGCYLFVGSGVDRNKVFYNLHPTGSSTGNVDSRHICESSGSK